MIKSEAKFVLVQVDGETWIEVLPPLTKFNKQTGEQTLSEYGSEHWAMKFFSWHMQFVGLFPIEEPNAATLH